MQSILFQHPLYWFELLNQNNILVFHWTDKTPEMSYEDFQEACSNYAGFAIEHQARKLLVDVRNFRATLPPEYTAWRESSLNTRYHRLGVQKFAYVVPSEAMHNIVNMPSGGETFTTFYFEHIPDALVWLEA